MRDVTEMGRSVKKNRSIGFQVGLQVVIATTLLSISFAAVFVAAASRLIVADAKTNTDQIIANVIPFAEMAAYSTSKFSAASALKLLSGSPSIAKAEIIDNFDDVLASYVNQELNEGAASGRELRRIDLHLGAGKQVYGVLKLDIVYRANRFARFFLYAGVGSIVLTSLSLAFILFAVFRSRVLQPVMRLKRNLSEWPAAAPEIALLDQDFGSLELDELSQTFQEALRRNVSANEERNRALSQRALIADAVNSALARADIFLAATGEGRDDRRMAFGAQIPAPMSNIIDELTAVGSDVGRVCEANSSGATVAMARRNPDGRNDGYNDVTFVEVALRDGRVWTLTCVDLDRDRRAVVGAETTELKKLSQEAESARRLEAVGVLASGVAHDFNNVLAVIIGALGLYERSVEPMPKLLIAALRAARRGAQVTRLLLDASRSDARAYGAVAISEITEEIELELKNILGPTPALNIRVETDSFVIAEASQLHTTLVNLIVNARDASESGHLVALSIRDATADEVRAQDLPRKCDFIVISIRDRGAGIPNDVLPRVFEPFYSTKRRGQGTGLGLALARSFALRSQGKILLHSERGIGTEVSLYLPSRKRVVTHKPSARNVDDRIGQLKGKRILVVEDEHELLDSLLEYLDFEGCHATGVGTLQEAMSIVGSNAAPPFDIILSDIVLPDGSGVTLLDYAATKLISSHIVLMGGNFDIHSLTTDQSSAMKAFLRKPFSLDEIAETILG